MTSNGCALAADHAGQRRMPDRAASL